MHVKVCIYIYTYVYIYICVCVLLYIQDISLWCQRASDILLMFMKGHRNNKGPLTS